MLQIMTKERCTNSTMSICVPFFNITAGCQKALIVDTLSSLLPYLVWWSKTIQYWVTEQSRALCFETDDTMRCMAINNGKMKNSLVGVWQAWILLRRKNTGKKAKSRKKL